MTKSKCIIPKCSFSMGRSSRNMCYAHFHDLDRPHRALLGQLYSTESQIKKLEEERDDYISEICTFIEQKTRPLNK